MLAAPKAIRDELKIIYQEGALDDPYVIALEIANVGRSAIRSDSFDKDRGITFEISAPIIRVLSAQHVPSSAPAPQFVSNGNLLELRPELIVKGELIRASLLTEGAVSDLRLVLNPFGDVGVEVRDRESWERKRSKRLTYVTAVLGALTLGSVIAAFISLGVARNRAEANLSTTMAIARNGACESLDLQNSSAELALFRVFEDVQVRLQKASNPLQVTIMPAYSKDLDELNLQVDTLQLDAVNANGLGINSKDSSRDVVLLNSIASILDRIPKDPSNEQKYKDFLMAQDKNNDALSASNGVFDQCKPYIQGQI
jgi:hypothetical protein